MSRTCKYEPCSKEFEPTHPRHEFCEPTCRANQHYLEHPEKGREIQGGALRSVATHPLTEARIKQEASELDDHLGQVIHQAIIDLIEQTGSAHADDLEPYYPEGHRDRCRELQPGRFGSLRSRGYIVSREARTSRVKTRNFAKSGVYVFTAKGRETLVGIEGKGNEGPAPLDPGESGGASAGVRPAQAVEGSSLSPDCAGSGFDAAPELRLFSDSQDYEEAA